MPNSHAPSLLRRLAFAICDADSSLEDMKHRHRCAWDRCLDGKRENCVAFRQARAAMKVVEAQKHVKDIAA